MSKIVIGSDHAGVGLKKDLISYLETVLKVECEDVGPYDDNSVDYPDYGHDVCNKVSEASSRGILICGTGIGMSIVANRHKGIRATLCNSTEDARLSREHNDSNVLVLGARKLEIGQAKNILDTWNATDFEGGRHEKRVNKIDGE